MVYSAIFYFKKPVSETSLIDWIMLDIVFWLCETDFFVVKFIRKVCYTNELW